MASLGSLPFTIEAKTESSMFVLSKNYHRASCSLKQQNQRPVEGVGFLGDKMVARSGNWPKPVQAKATSSGSNNDPEEAIQATIEKSKKVLAMQQELLEQVYIYIFLKFFLL